MAKAKTIYSCTECGAISPKWQGQCPGCEVWNTLVETVAESAPASNSRFAALGGTARLQTLSEIEAREEGRLPTGIGEFDRALGGGLVADLSRDDMARMMKRRLHDAGLSRRLSPHSLRVTTITDLLEQGVPLADVQYLAGHADPRTTRLYDRRQRRVTRNIVERISV